MTAPTSPKPATPADPNDLRTALTKLADEMEAGSLTGRFLATEIRALLAAHPAPETGMEAAKALCLADTSWEHHDRTDDFPCSSCVSDARREDVARALEKHAAWVGIPDEGAECGCGEVLTTDPGVFAANLWRAHRADAVLAALPAPPVVDKAEVRERIAQDIEARLGGWGSVAVTEAARIARGATR